MEGIKAIIIGVDELTEEDAQRYHVIYRMDGETPITEGEDILADEYLEDENIILGWDGDGGAPELPEYLQAANLVEAFSAGCRSARESKEFYENKK